MDSDSERRAAEVRHRRLQHLGRAEVHEPDNQQHDAQLLSNVPVASSTLTLPGSPPSLGAGEVLSFVATSSGATPSSPLVPLVSAVEPAPAASSLPASSSSEQTVVVVLSGRSAHDLLTSLRTNLSSGQSAALAASSNDRPRQNVVQASAGLTVVNHSSTSAAKADVLIESCSTSKASQPTLSWEQFLSLPSTSKGGGKENLCPTQQSGRAGRRVIVASDSSDIDSDIDSEKQQALNRKNKFNWREHVPSVSSSGAHNFAAPAKRKAGRPKGSRNNRSATRQELDPVIVNSSSDSDCGHSKPPSKKANFGESLAFNTSCRDSLRLSTSSGVQNQMKPPAAKRKPGRPRGSKNRNKSAVKQEPINSDMECHICRDSNRIGLCITDCGHLFHAVCLERWITTSSQKYRSRKTCPYCGGVFINTIKFFG